jgi:hypothetical protein
LFLAFLFKDIGRDEERKGEKCLGKDFPRRQNNIMVACWEESGKCEPLKRFSHRSESKLHLVRGKLRTLWPCGMEEWGVKVVEESLMQYGGAVC